MKLWVLCMNRMKKNYLIIKIFKKLQVLINKTSIKVILIRQKVLLLKLSKIKIFNNNNNNKNNKITNNNNKDWMCKKTKINSNSKIIKIIIIKILKIIYCNSKEWI